MTAALDNPDGHALYRAQEARADAQDKQRRAVQREAQRPVCKRCGQKFTDERWEEVTVHRTAVRAGDKSVCALAAPTTSPARKSLPKPPASRPSRRRSRRTTPSRTGAAAGFRWRT
ncbi:hypothetical protein [Streptomyces capparidis]